MADKKIKDKVKRRDRVVTSLLRQAEFLEEYDDSQIGQIQARLDKLEKKYDDFEEIQEEIAALDEKGDYKEECLNVDKEFETEYFRIRAEFLEKLQVTTTAAFDTSIVRNNTALGNHTGVRLPQISLPEFNGDYRNWLSFKSTFVSLIHESIDLNTVQKFHYLKSALKGEAARLIQSLTVTGENYIIAWETITKRYSNEYLLRKRHLQALMEFPKLDHDSAAAIHGLVDEFEQRLKILKQLGERTEHWGSMIVHWMCSKLDKRTLQLWEDHVVLIKDPSFSVLLDFLERRTRVLEAVSSNTVEFAGKSVNKRQRAVVSAATEGESKSLSCCCCGEPHFLARCSRFQKMRLNERLQLVNTKRLCSNCFRTGHWVRDCSSKSNCRTCDKRHHSMIHPGFPAGGGTANKEKNSSISEHVSQRDTQGMKSNVVTDSGGVSTSEGVEEQSVGSYSAEIKSSKSNIFLSTVILTVRDCNGQKRLARALLDNGSQINIISERLCQMLRLKRRAVNVPICGIGRTESKARQAVYVNIGSRTTGFSEQLDFLVMPRITSELPSVIVPIKHWRIPERIQLADPEFNVCNSIDLLLGAEHFYEFFREHAMKRISLGPDLPILVDTVFGWVVSGRALCSTEQVVSCCLATTSENLDDLLERFWRIESTDNTPAWSKEEKDCEEHFVQTHSRNIDGRYVVQLPKRINFKHILGNSRSVALRRFMKLEKRLEQDANMRIQYHSFMAEYLQLGHMRKVTCEKLELKADNGDERTVCYLPHHAVLKESSTTTKVRVVFDGSAQTDSGYSLNEALLKGPTIQDELLCLLLRFRKYEVALIGDLEKMYRQVNIHDDDTQLQRIFWRFTGEEPVTEYELLTVTYGLTPSSFLATRVLRQLAEDEGNESVEAKNALTNDFYVDDYIGGASSVETAIILRDQLTRLLEKGGFVIRKWCSNKLDALDGVPLQHLGTSSQINFDINSTDEIKTLGISWEPTTDQLRFSFGSSVTQTEWTKRRILSSIAKLFDPLGLISPIVITAKIFMQELALLNCGWDDPVPSNLEQRWLAFYKDLAGLAELRINRFAFVSGWVTVQLHCFADASELAYGTCIYVRSTDSTDNVQVELLASKSRVAPLKRLTLPRLELCAAKEAAMLYEKVSKSLSLGKIPVIFWSDSTIVLHWLKAPPNSWKTFVANRVSSIQTSSYGHVWRHVSGKENPADLVSRGIPVNDFIQSKLWRQGPEWLQNADNWPNHTPDNSFSNEQLEVRVILPAVVINREPNPLFTLRSSLNSLLRIVSYCLRFIHNTRFPTKRNIGSLTVKEIGKAKLALTYLAQSEHFSDEINQLRKRQLVSKKSPLRLLSPFLDENDTIRVGGRLQNSSVDYGTMHPAVLPTHHPFTRMLINDFHRQTQHGGRNLTLSTMRQEFWPIHGKQAVNAVLRKCYRCFRVNPAKVHQPIGQLPGTRVRPSKPFSVTGVDYCGPFFLKPPHRRAAAPKFYIAVFICFATKAIHLEMVSDLSTAGFLSALHRFIGRYGVPSQIHSDNATNFAGANNELKELYQLLSDKHNQTQIHSDCSRQGIEWHFIPPRAPNFGGLWEAAVRSVKSSLKKQIGTQQLNYESFSTLLVQITAALNSRPLTPLSDDPSDLEVLTPAHFLIGTAMNAVPEPDYRHSATNRLSHYQQRQQLFQQFWVRWTKEYLHNLQVISKQHQSSSIRTGSIVVLLEDNQPPLHWPLARIIELHPGSDGVVRVVTVRTRNGTYKRPVNKICPLPTENEE